MNDPLVPTSPEDASPKYAPEATPTPSHAVETGIVIYPTLHLEIASSLYACVQMGARIDFEVKQVVHVPKARENIIKGLEFLATLQGMLFRQLCDLWKYDAPTFYEAIEKYSTEQETIRRDQEKLKQPKS